jgi:hypothetical protein
MWGGRAMVRRSVRPAGVNVHGHPEAFESTEAQLLVRLRHECLRSSVAEDVAVRMNIEARRYQ